MPAINRGGKNNDRREDRRPLFPAALAVSLSLLERLTRGERCSTVTFAARAKNSDLVMRALRSPRGDRNDSRRMATILVPRAGGGSATHGRWIVAKATAANPEFVTARQPAAP